MNLHLSDQQVMPDEEFLMIKVLSFANETVTNENIDTIVATLNNTDNAYSKVILNLSKKRIDIDKDRLSNLLNAIKTTTVLTELNMEKMVFNLHIDKCKIKLLESCLNNRSLRKLNLTNWKLNREIKVNDITPFEILIDIIKLHPFLEELILKGCAFKEDPLDMIIRAIQQNPNCNLTKLSLYSFTHRKISIANRVEQINALCESNKLLLEGMSTTSNRYLRTFWQPAPTKPGSQESGSSANLTSEHSSVAVTSNEVDTTQLKLMMSFLQSRTPSMKDYRLQSISEYERDGKRKHRSGDEDKPASKRVAP